ncbi:MAG TPA: FAD-dependent monooxygenase, partial [Candidatus Binatia bacterium]|nr:FAD-dependent monooxygenase [Candidatus Binatia bacterium]
MRSGTPSATEPPVAVIGAGAVGLTLAGRLAQHGARVELFEATADRERIGSRAICMQRETLEIWARLGAGERVAERGVRWRVGRTYFRGRQLFETRLPDHDEHFPPFVNISQSEVEDLLEARAAELGVRIHRGHRFSGLAQDPDGVDATFETDVGAVTRRFSHLVGTDGAHSSVRHAARIAFDGYTFDDRFLIADIRADLPFTSERHFHFDPPWNPGRQVLIHPQPDGIWRIDWQVPPETDADAERASGGLDRRIRAVVGERTAYELVWVTGYRFSQRVAATFRDGRVILAGDAAHVMSPFGARGLNSGVADVENLAWRLAAVARGAPDRLLDAYEVERRPAALANLAATDATMRFMAPHGLPRRTWRDLVLRMAPRSAWFRRRVNSGRLAEPATYSATGPEDASLPRHGSVAPDVPLPAGERLRDELGSGFVLLAPRPLGVEPAVPVVVIGPGSVYGDDRAWLVRPDGYLASSAALGDA